MTQSIVEDMDAIRAGLQRLEQERQAQSVLGTEGSPIALKGTINEFAARWFNAPQIINSPLWFPSDHDRSAADFYDSRDPVASTYWYWLMRWEFIARLTTRLEETKLIPYLAPGPSNYRTENIRVLLIRMRILKMI